ncbi:MAG: trypsin-like peptidase domain-containing protein [Dysgonamonadaceae bacterium]|jgi:Do/DeqQ family serine protease|nr:trypsin-like peptidase domain-containing protein [Dysgonamonadaceae bacterium]
MKNWKIFFGAVFVCLLSVGATIGTYSYLGKADKPFISGEFNQAGFQAVGYNTVAAENTDFTLAAEQSVNAVVHIKSVVNPGNSQQAERRGRSMDPWSDPFEFFFGQMPRQQRPQVGFGSGVIISKEGYIVTNNHVIAGANEIQVTTNDEQTFKAKLVGTDEATDIALLKIDGKNLPVIPFGDSDALKVGEWVLAVGNPFNLTSTVTAGIVSAKGRGSVFSGYGYGGQGGVRPQDKVESFIQTDAAVNPGNSGGALVNTKGELVGINTAIYSETGNFVGYSFAVPISLVKKVVSDIREYGAVQRAILGVSIIDVPALKELSESQRPDVNAKEYAEKYNRLKVKEGVYVDGFSLNSSAQKAGLKEGDVIIAINGTKVKTSNELKALVNRYRPGNIVEVQVNRNGDVKTCKVELKNDQGTTALVKNRSIAEVLGAEFKALSPETKRAVGVNYGVEVTKVTNGKLKEYGIKDGFIILTAGADGVRIDSPETLNKIIETALKQAPDERVLYIKGLYPNDRVRFYAIDLTE